MKILAKTKDNEEVYIIQFVMNCKVLAITVNKEGILNTYYLKELTIIDSDYITNKTENKNEDDIFKPIPMNVFNGHIKIGTIYPKGWIYDGTELQEDLAVPSKSKYANELLKYKLEQYQRRF